MFFSPVRGTRKSSGKFLSSGRSACCLRRASFQLDAGQGQTLSSFKSSASASEDRLRAALSVRRRPVQVMLDLLPRQCDAPLRHCAEAA
jgi:hypothetical protein